MYTLGAGLTTPDEFHMARRLFADAERTLPADDWHNLHFLYNCAGYVCYRRRDDVPDALQLAVYYCERQVAIAEQARKLMLRELLTLPSHRGFQQLTIIHAAHGEYAEAIALCEQAKAGGWQGDWDARIVRYKKKLGAVAPT
jgi:hypothetical protein